MMQEDRKEGNCVFDALGTSALAALDWHQPIFFGRFIPRRHPSITAPMLMKVGAVRLVRPVAHAAIKLRRFFGLSAVGRYLPKP